MSEAVAEPSAAENPPELPLEARLDALFTAVNRTDCPGVSVGVAYKGETLYRKAFGLATVQHGLANTPSTRMRIGSTSKHFTCFAALLLREDGKLDIDAPVTEYLRELKGSKFIPTLRQFMHHTSGIRCSLDVAMTANGDAKQPDGWSLDLLASQEGVNFEPLHGQMYCNGGYHLLSIAIDRAAGTSMEEFLKERVFIPLGMLDTECVKSDELILEGAASLHLPDPTGGHRRGGFFTTEIRGEGNIVSTVDDMLRWLAHMNGTRTLGSEETWQLMFETPTLATGVKSVYSMGLQSHKYRGLNVVHHAGSVIGGNSQMITVPDEELDVVILANGMNANAQELALQIIDIVLEDSISDGKPEIAPFEKYEHLSGKRYVGSSGAVVHFGPLADRLGTSFMGMPLMPILRESDTGLYAGFEHVALGPLEFSDLDPKADGSAPDAITFSESGNPETLLQVQEEPDSGISLAPVLEGTYYSNDARSDVSILIEGDDLILSIRGDYSASRKFRIEKYTDSSLGIRNIDEPAAGCGMMIRERDENGNVTSFDINTIRSRHLSFDRNGAAR